MISTSSTVWGSDLFNVSGQIVTKITARIDVAP